MNESFPRFPESDTLRILQELYGSEVEPGKQSVVSGSDMPSSDEVNLPSGAPITNQTGSTLPPPPMQQTLPPA